MYKRFVFRKHLFLYFRGGFILFEEMMNDEVTLIKQDGEKYKNIKADVQTEKIFISNGKIPIEEGDKIKRILPNNLIETYIVLDRGFKKGFSEEDYHYQCKVKKETTINTENNKNKKIIYNVNGENSRVNINSTDKSTNTVNLSSEELFDELREVIKENISSNEEIIKSINEMEENKDNEQLLYKYQKFIALMSNHMNLIAPFIPALSQLIEKT